MFSSFCKINTVWIVAVNEMHTVWIVAINERGLSCCKRQTVSQGDVCLLACILADLPFSH